MPPSHISIFNIVGTLKELLNNDGLVNIPPSIPPFLVMCHPRKEIDYLKSTLTF